MINLLYCECIKLKGLRLHLLMLASVLFTGLLEYSAILYQKHTNHVMFTWDWLIYTNIRYIALLIIPIVLSLFTGYVVAREFVEKTASVLFLPNYPRRMILFAKQLIVLPFLSFLVFVELLVTIAAGLLLPGHPPLTLSAFGEYTRIYLQLLAMCICFIPICFLVGIRFKSYIISAVFGLFVMVAGVVVINSPSVGIWYPWTAVAIVLDHSITGGPMRFLDIALWKGYLSLSLILIVPFFVNGMVFNKMDIYE